MFAKHTFVSVFMHIKKVIKYFLIKIAGSSNTASPFKFYELHLLLLYALAVHKKLTIVQIGANDGVSGDPLHKFITQHGKDLNVIFFEPQKKPFAKLKDNYRNYSHFKFVNKAIGAPGLLTFYNLNEKYKEFVKQKSGSSIGTGTNSFIKEHLIRRMKRYGVTDFDRYLDTEQLELIELLEELKKYEEFKGRIDLLQVDCEGYDDIVIYHCAIKTIQPRIINFESKNLSKDKLRELVCFLENNGYTVTQYSKSDTLAIKTY